MKTTLDLPDDLMTAVKIRAAQENRKMKDIVAEALRQNLGLPEHPARHGVRDIKPVSAGAVIVQSKSEDRLGDMLNERGHRY